MRGLSFFLPIIAFVGAPAWATPSVEVVYHAAFYSSGTPEWEDLPLTANISASALRSIPFASRKFSMVDFRCDHISYNGKLKNCKIDEEPKGDRLRKTAQRILREIRVDKKFVKEKSHKIEWMSIQVRVSNSDQTPFLGPCWPPSCSIVLPPPPPPKPDAS